MKLLVLLPTYNNVASISMMVNRLLPFGFFILVVNDGSHAEMHSLLEKLNRYDGLNVLHRAHNGGKGAAVIDGIHWAARNGYSHVLQLDADNQHLIEDLPRFVAAAEDNPRAFILGKPIFPANTPKLRLNGRKISIVWVWIETLSTQIKDPLFGYRLYPVAQTQKALRCLYIGKRMDFDPEIAVRLFWQGTQVVNVETPVTYHEDGVSHFHLFYDNVRISWMHTRLFIGMLSRSGFLLGRRIFSRWVKNR